MVSDMGPLIVMSASTVTRFAFGSGKRHVTYPGLRRGLLVEVEGADRFIQTDSAHGLGQ